MKDGFRSCPLDRKKLQPWQAKNARVEKMGDKLSTYVGPVKYKNCGHVFNKTAGQKTYPKCSRDLLVKTIDDTLLERD
jgi:hypothetical protein